MKDFSYTAAGSIREALAAHGQGSSAMYLAGGTTVVDLLRAGVFQPDSVVEITGLPLRHIRVDGEATLIGAMASNAAVAWNPAIKKMFPVVSQALLAGASAQIRNMATTGGNLLQRTRCPYYRDLTAPCNRRSPGTGCAALPGFNRSHAILGGSDHCVATHPSDFAVALTAVDARLRLSGPDGKREVALTEFYLLPGRSPARETVLRAGELITEVLIPHDAAHGRSLYLKVRDRQSFEFALASAAVAAEMTDGVLKGVRIALGGVATVPWRARAAEAVLEGQRPAPGLFRRAAEAELAAARPLPHNRFKVELAKRTLAAALQRWGDMG